MRRRTVAPRLLAVLAAASLAACRGTAGPSPGQLTFRVLEEDAPAAGPDEAGVRVSGGDVVVEGVLRTPTPCWGLEGSLARDGRRLRLEVEARERDVDACIQVLENHVYRARIAGLAPGTYELLLTHARASETGRSSKVVLEADVTVP